jgi:DNA-directed RNA polymerase III subunit RPC2
VITSDAASQG